MPELPEVETIRRDLKKIIKKKFKTVEILDEKIISGSKKEFEKNITDKEIINISRIGKLIIIKLSGNLFFLIHLKMTGQLIYCRQGKLIAGGHSLGDNFKIPGIGNELPNKHTRAIFTLSDQSKIFYNDLRRFGYLKLVDGKFLKNKKAEFGSEPLDRDFSFGYLKEKAKNRKINIKQFLLDQKIIAGIGNIYADEILFRSKISPARPAGSLKDNELKKITESAKIIILEAIKHRGTTFSNFVDSEGKRGNYSSLLKVYGRKDEKCLICGGKIKKIKLNGRGTHFCSKCQK